MSAEKFNSNGFSPEVISRNPLSLGIRQKLLERIQGLYEKNFHRCERVYGTFQRSFELGTAVDAAKIKAEYKNGVLRVTLPKTEEAKPKRIDVGIN